MTATLAIIIPHKNTPQKLRRLLASIPQLAAVTIIVVDDNSDPELRAHILSGEFPWVRFEPNPGPDYNAGAARNVGLKAVNAEWLLFADADDYFVDEGIESVLFEIDSVSDQTDIIFFDITSLNERSGEVGFRHRGGSERLKQFLADGNETPVRFQCPTPCGKAIRRSLLTCHQIRFDSVPAGNDVIFSLVSGYHARGLVGVSKVIYCVTESDDSLTARLTPERALARLDVLIRTNLNLLNWRIKVRLDWGATYFIRSLKAPWSMQKLNVYVQYGTLLFKRLAMFR